ncbi:MAG: single-stranded DNA-binding protein [Spirochaetales bacterium]|nr:single-stranded DNA-binding protein [Spirochaetales bacterium]
MTNALNLSIIEGRLVRVPELRRTSGGKAITSLTIAVNEFYKSEGKTQSQATFLTCTVWDKAAERCTQYLIKGQLVRIKGKLHQSIWIDNNGEKHSKLEIIANNVDFLDKPKKNAGKTADNQYEAVPF